MMHLISALLLSPYLQVQEPQDRSASTRPWMRSREGLELLRHQGRGFGIFTAGIFGAQALNALVFGEQEQFWKHAKEMASWKFLSEYVAFSIGMAGGQRLYQLGHRILPRWGIVHHFAGRTVPLALGLGAMDAVRGEFDLSLLALSLVTLELGSWMTQVQLATLRWIPFVRICKSVPNVWIRGAAEAAHLALTLFNAGVLTRGLVAGLQWAQEIVHEDQIREELVAALRECEKEVSVATIQKVSVAFSRYRESLFRRRVSRDSEARKRFPEDRTSAYSDLLSLPHAEERARLMDRVLKPIQKDLQKSYDRQLELDDRLIPFAKDEASRKLLRSELRRLGEEKATAGGVHQHIQELSR